MSWHPTISREIECFPSATCGIFAAALGFASPANPSAPPTPAAANAAEIAVAALRNSRRSYASWKEIAERSCGRLNWFVLIAVPPSSHHKTDYPAAGLSVVVWYLTPATALSLRGWDG